MYADTISAIATAPGEGAIGIVRLSGPDAGRIAAAIFRRAGTKRSAKTRLASHRLHYGHIVDPATERVIDEVLLTRMSPPRTYTREEVVEISCHGGPTSVREILALCLRCGARAANPGEFTLRAFANGRIDLSQAEAVAAIVAARTTRAHELAIDELRGRLSRLLRPARDVLVEALAYLDAAADFPDDEIPSFDLGSALSVGRDALAEVISAGRTGMLYREGVRIAIVGRPNVGKSSLLNALLRTDRAIVTPLAGTTRDVISESINLRGIPATLLDTAGIADTEDMIEQLGIDRSRQALAASNVVVLVLDRSSPTTADDRRVAELLRERLDAGGVVVVRNKSDLPAAIADDDLVPGALRIDVSATTGVGLDQLEDALHAAAVAGTADASEPALVTTRQFDALRRAHDAVVAAIDARETGVPIDLLSVDVREALEAIGEITGENVSEAVLDEIFSRFCIGK